VPVCNAEVLQILILFKNYIKEFKKAIKQDRISGAGGTNARKETRIQGFGGDSGRKETT
jgi:hypothetical protein